MKNKFVKITICISILFILILFGSSVYNSKFSIDDNKIHSKNIIMSIEESINSADLDDNLIKKINEYLSEKKENSEYYFTKGYLDYMNDDYNNAIKNFNLASKNITISDSSFLKIYTYILLNESLQMENQYDLLTENCKIALSYISQNKIYKNDVTLLWRAISVLMNNESQIEDSITLLNSYLGKTKGLTNESIVKLTSNIGQLYTLVNKYSDAMYNYLDAINYIENNPSIPDGDYYKIKLLTNIGDINFILKQYEVAIKYYDEALSITLDDKSKDASSKSVTMINKCQTYIDLKEYELCIQNLDELNDFLPYLDPDIKDDIEILSNSILTLAHTAQHNFEEAERCIKISIDLLSKDKVEFSLNKDAFVYLSYAKLYKEQKLYDQALSIYNHVLTESINKGLELEDDIYKEVSEIYKEKQDLNNYIKYNELYIKYNDDNTSTLNKDYMEYSYITYENDLLKEKSYKYGLNLIIMVFSLIILSIIIFYKTRAVKKLRHSNFTDSMTGLYNRKYLSHYITKHKKKLLEKPLTVMIIDIDYFKKYNDNYGHIEGDKIIKEVANTLKNSIRKDDVAVRYGGEEMVLILPDISSNVSENIAKNIQTNLKNKNIEHKYSEVDNILTISIGIYTTKFLDQDIYSLINKADIALYNSKKSGRNKYTILSD